MKAYIINNIAGQITKKTNGKIPMHKAVEIVKAYAEEVGADFESGMSNRAMIRIARQILEDYNSAQ